MNKTERGPFDVIPFEENITDKIYTWFCNDEFMFSEMCDVCERGQDELHVDRDDRFRDYVTLYFTCDDDIGDAPREIILTALAYVEWAKLADRFEDDRKNGAA